GDRAAFARAEHEDPPPGELVQIEPVQRMPELEHREVRRVHRIADRPHAAGAKPLLDVQGRGTDVHALDDPRDVPGATLRVLDVDPRRRLALSRGPRRGYPPASAPDGRQ